jgi:hypothetical protein
MLEDMSVRKIGTKTLTDYIRQIVTFAAFLGRSPETASAALSIAYVRLFSGSDGSRIDLRL